jgi:hypothetical protein
MTKPARQEDSGHHDGHQFPASFLDCSPPARGVCQHSCLACEAVSWTGNDAMIFGATIRH